MSTHIAGLGTAVPSHTIDQKQALELAYAVLRPDARNARLLKPLYRRSGVQNRHICVPSKTALEWMKDYPANAKDDQPKSHGATTRTRMALYEEHAPPLAIEAAKEALKNADFSSGSITHIVTVSCTGFCAPGVDARLIHGLELSAETQRIHVGFMGCHGAINGIRVAQSLASLDSTHRVLLCAVELCSLHYCFDWVPDRLVSNAIFADGAAALALSAMESATVGCKVVATGSHLFPGTDEAMSWRLGNHGFEMALDAKVPDLIGCSLKPWLTNWLVGQGVEPGEVAHWAIHPGGPRIVSAVAEALDLPPEATAVSRDVLSRYGNMSSPTVLFILNELHRNKVGGPCVMIAFGPGLVAEVTLLWFRS